MARLFARCLFLRPTPEQLTDFAPSGRSCTPATSTPTRPATAPSPRSCVAISFEQKLVVACGTHYAGEIKKAIFTVLNYLLPQKGVFPMHCSANVGAGRRRGAVLRPVAAPARRRSSADPERRLIGDDEHGWGDDGVFNIEGGCYAKTIKLSAAGEPQIWNALRFGCVLENVPVDPVTRKPDFDSQEYTENTRAAYPVDFIPNCELSRRRRAPEEHLLPDVRRVRRAAAAGAADARAGGRVLPVRLHGEGGGHGGRRDGADAGVQHVLREAVPAAAAEALRRDAEGEAGAAHGPGVAGEHRLDRRPVRRRQADEAGAHAGAAEGGADGATGGRVVRAGPGVRAGGAGDVPRRAGRGAAPARRVGRTRPPTTAKAKELAERFKAEFKKYA